MEVAEDGAGTVAVFVVVMTTLFGPLFFCAAVKFSLRVCWCAA